MLVVAGAPVLAIPGAHGGMEAHLAPKGAVEGEDHVDVSLHPSSRALRDLWSHLSSAARTCSSAADSFCTLSGVGPAFPLLFFLFFSLPPSGCHSP